MLLESDSIGNCCELWSSDPVAKQLQRFHCGFAVVFALRPGGSVFEVNFDMRVATDTGAQARLSRAVNFGEDGYACAASAGNLVVGKQTLAMAAPRRVMKNDKWLGKVGEEGGPAGGG